jgi:hypothetical protein
MIFGEFVLEGAVVSQIWREENTRAMKKREFCLVRFIGWEDGRRQDAYST